MNFPVPTLSAPPAGAGDTLVDAFGGRYCLISRSDELPPFLMNVVSSSDLWLFLASNGGLTAGRVDPDHALFPYQTVDRIYDSAGVTGPFTAIRLEAGGREVLWEPFAAHTPRVHEITRHLYKSVEGDRVWFEEINSELGLAFRYGWATAEAHGFVRQCALANLNDAPVAVHLLDGLRNLLPPGINPRLQRDSSCLVDAYKTAELLPDSTLAVYALAAGITDRPEPIEALRASTVWSEGVPGANILLSAAQLGAFYRGETVTTETRCRGQRHVYALAGELTLAPHATQSWLMVADYDLAQADVTARHRAVRAGGLDAEVRQAVDASTQRLRALVGRSDGLQASGAEPVSVHHFANTLFNLLRGGVFAAGYTIAAPDFAAFVRGRNPAVAARHAAVLAALPATLPRADLLARLAAGGDRDLERLGLEYLPLVFSRRHGDPSRPWNRFSIQVRGADGARVFHHEGNWRDIFQNWEALCHGFPEYFESVIAIFLNASTIDGYNPYRLSRDGVEWEVPDPADPWASIGYWGDHQVVYLLKLLEWSSRFHPGALARWLRRELFTFVDVPYRIASFENMRTNPHLTIEFDAARDRAIAGRIAPDGADARLLRGADGAILHVNLAEKLLLLLLTRLANFVPGGGIWMNTQRPEWNDANNALVGYGVSSVTLCYLRRLLGHVRDAVFHAPGAEPIAVSAPLATFARRIAATLDAHAAVLAAPEVDDAARRAIVEGLSGAGSDYRAAVYADPAGGRATIAPDEIDHLLATALAFVDHTLRANRRPDGLFHAYNLLEFTESPPGLKLQRLEAMLEGQVAALSSGLLAPAEAAALLGALRASPLYRADQHTYLLYPDRQLPAFLARNVIAAEFVASAPLLTQLLAAGDERLVLRDGAGVHRFHPDLVNREALDARLRRLAAEPRWAEPVRRDAARVAAIFEAVFHHRAFTGRSGSMFGYEGLGCTYWHMVAKLLLAVQENFLAAVAARDPAAAELARRYHDIRAGLGFNKSARDYGAFPTDPYSHTPGHSGAQQPGMTGQVKEEILTRFGELGVAIAGGTVTFDPLLLEAAEFTAAPTAFRHVAGDGAAATIPLPAGALAFTFCGVPVIYRRTDGERCARVVLAGDSPAREVSGATLDAAASRELFARTGRILRVEVDLGAAFAPFAS
ncbi:MAG TPA: hypothetical protein VHE13_06575 [Opitutus sp.]|nr:hypothetical protein [Opitutus sp.]